MYCTKCGKQLSDGIKFCTNCGQPVAACEAFQSTPQSQTTAQEQAVEQKQTQAESQPSMQQSIPFAQPSENTTTSSKKTLSIIVIIIGSAIALVLIGLIIYFGSGLFQNRSEKGKEEYSVSESQETLASDSAKNEEGIDTTSGKSESVLNEGETEADTETAMAETVTEEEQLLSADTKEGILQREIIELNASSYEKQTIDVYKNTRPVGERDTSYIWDDTVFYTLEGYQEHSDYCNKNLCTLIKKELINKASGNVMDYEIYMNPQSDVANKIVSIEYLDDGIEVTEYYYNKNKEISFIFQYKTDNYVSTYATPDKQGQRFLFNKDCLVTWRDVSADDTKNYSIGQNEIERLKDKWAKKTLIEYSSLDDDTKALFDLYEKNMLNAAYNTYETVMNAEGISIIQGYIFDQNSSGLPDSTIELYDEAFENKLFSTTTASDGSYRIYVPFEEYLYNVRVVKEEYDDCNIYNVEVNNEQIGVFQDSLHMFKADEADTAVSMTLGDAFNYNASNTGMVLLSNANINIRKGINNRTGTEIIFSGITDENGYIQVMLKPGEYTLEVLASGYETMYYTIIANPVLSNIYEFYAAPQLNENEYAIVLTWGATPYDLDSHLFTTKDSSSTHIWYGGMSDRFGNNLDVDDTSSYGPETVTIDSLSSTDYYKFCVVDFTDCVNGNLSSYDMSNSQATVNVYSSDGLLGTFHVPTNTPGVIWEVFEIRNGRLTPIQRYYDNVTNKDWWHQEK